MLINPEPLCFARNGCQGAFPRVKLTQESHLVMFAFTPKEHKLFTLLGFPCMLTLKAINCHASTSRKGFVHPRYLLYDGLQSFGLFQRDLEYAQANLMCASVHFKCALHFWLTMQSKFAYFMLRNKIVKHMVHSYHYDSWKNVLLHQFQGV